MIARELDLPYPKQDIQKLDYPSLLNLLLETFKLFRLQLGRFVGFKTSQGSDNFPNDWYGPQWLFLSPKNATFSSSVNDGPVMVTGIYHSEDLYDFLPKNPLLNRILNIELRDKRNTDFVLKQTDCS